MMRNTHLRLVVFWIFLGSLQPATAGDVVLKATIGGHEVQIYDDFLWDYIQTDNQCYKGAAVGLAFCGLGKGWKVFADRQNGIPPVFTNSKIGPSINEGAIFGIITSGTDNAVMPTYVLQYTLEHIAAKELGIQQSEMNITDFNDETVDNIPAITIVYDAEVLGFPIEAVMTGWYVGNRLYRFRTIIQIRGHKEELLDVHRETLTMIKPID